MAEIVKKQDETTLHNRIHMYKDFTIFWTWRIKLIIFRKFFLFDILSTNWTNCLFYTAILKCIVNKEDFLKMAGVLNPSNQKSLLRKIPLAKSLHRKIPPSKIPPQENTSQQNISGQNTYQQNTSKNKKPTHELKMVFVDILLMISHAPFLSQIHIFLP